VTWKRRLTVWGGLAAGMVALFCLMPAFHVIPKDKVERPQGFDAKAYIDRFWTEKLIPGVARADDALQVVSDLQKDRGAARKKYAHSMGLGETYSYFVRGTGRIVAVEKNAVRVSLREGDPKAEVLLHTGPLFGNAVRDGTGLLNVSEFDNLIDFNALSFQINDRIEAQVLPKLRNAAVGAQVSFVGCAEITNEDKDLNPLRIVPFEAEVP
jgi:predicted lipoprotein